MEEVVPSLLGCVLERALVAQHVFEDAVTEDLRLWLSFAERPTYTVRGRNGQHLVIELGEPEPDADMQEYGQIRVVPVPVGHPLHGFLGHALRDAAPIRSRVQGECGVQLRFDQGCLNLIEYCDELELTVGELRSVAPLDELTIASWDWQGDPIEVLCRRAGSIITQQLLAGADFDTALARVKTAGIYMIPTLKGTMTALGVGLRDARILVETSPVHNAQAELFVEERTEILSRLGIR